jgi:hypothetical protein
MAGIGVEFCDVDILGCIWVVAEDRWERTSE